MIINGKNNKYKIDNSLIIILIITILNKNIFIFFYYYFISYFFVIIHEYSHVLVSKIFNIKVNKIYFKIGGMCASIENNNNNIYKYIIIYLAGPLVNLILYLIFLKYEYVSKINIILCVINLIPIKPLDGYNILSKIISKDKIQKINFISIVIFTMLNFYFVLHKKYYGFCIFIIYIISLNCINKIESDKK